jgi:Fuc2NAc and GlcNAc transferase
MSHALTFLTGLFLLSYTLTWIARIAALRRNIIDLPNHRSSHTDPTPRGGGIAIVITWFSGITCLYFFNHLDKNLYMALITGILLAGIGLVDDLISITPLLRFIFQLITAIIAFAFIGGMQPVILFNGIVIPAVALYPVAVIGIVWFINLYNFLDGIDGYASIEAILLGVAFLMFSGNVINGVLIASVSGFLIWNRPKAKIFMGDVASTQLGFIIVILGIYYHNEEKLAIIWWLVLTSPFWFDATLTLYRRWRNKEKLSIAHRKHVYQRLTQVNGFSHLRVDIFLIALDIFLIIIVVLFKDIVALQLPALILSVILMFLITKLTDKRKPFLPG